VYQGPANKAGIRCGDIREEERCRRFEQAPREEEKRPEP